MRLVDDRERRARLAVRHGLHPDHRASDPVTAAEAVVCLHATEAATVHLAVGARTTGIAPVDVERSLYEDRSLVKQLAMRRTLFAFPRDLLPAALGVALSRLAPEQRRLISRDAARHGIAEDGDAWLDAAGGAVVSRLTGSAPLSARALREELPELSGAITVNEDKRYGGTFNLAPRVLTWLGAEGRITRGANAGHWRLSKPAWALLPDWLGEIVTPLALDEAYAQLVRRWLSQFGPGTLEDVQWWLGATKGATRAALAAVGAVEVALERDRTGGCCRTTSIRSRTSPHGPHCSRPSTRRRWGGSTARPISTRPTASCSSTASATAGARPGGTAGSWAPGSRTTTASSPWSSAPAPTSVAKGGPPSPSRRSD